MPVDARGKKNETGAGPSARIGEKKHLALRRNNDDFCGLRLKRNNEKKAKCQGAGGLPALCVGVAH